MIFIALYKGVMIMRLRTTALIIVISMLMMLFTGCGSNHTGKYYHEEDESFYIELKDNNVFTVNRGDTVLEGEYEIEGEDITLTLMGMKSWGKIYGKIIVDPDGTFWTKK